NSMVASTTGVMLVLLGFKEWKGDPTCFLIAFFILLLGVWGLTTFAVCEAMIRRLRDRINEIRGSLEHGHPPRTADKANSMGVGRVPRRGCCVGFGSGAYYRQARLAPPQELPPNQAPQRAVALRPRFFSDRQSGRRVSFHYSRFLFGVSLHSPPGPFLARILRENVMAYLPPGEANYRAERA